MALLITVLLIMVRHIVHTVITTMHPAAGRTITGITGKIAVTLSKRVSVQGTFFYDGIPAEDDYRIVLK